METESKRIKAMKQCVVCVVLLVIILTGYMVVSNIFGKAND